jgi:hypothetical protein
MGSHFTHDRLLVDRLKPDYATTVLNAANADTVALQVLLDASLTADADERATIRDKRDVARQREVDLLAAMTLGLQSVDSASVLGMPSSYKVAMRQLPACLDAGMSVYRALFDLDTVQAVLPAFCQLTNLSFVPACVAKYVPHIVDALFDMFGYCLFVS